MMTAAVLAVASLLCPAPAHGDLFKLDFGTSTNGAASMTQNQWNVFGTWLFKDFTNGIATWRLTDWSPDHNTNVTLTITDNAPLAKQIGAWPATGMEGEDTSGTELDVVYDGIPVVLKNAFMFRYGELGDFAGTEMLFRFANLSPGHYNVTLFERYHHIDLNGQYGKICVDDINGKKEPADQNTGDFSATRVEKGVGVPALRGNPKTVSVDIRAGDYLWIAYLEDNHGGVSGMIIRSVATLVDTDGDGLPDYWETEHGLNPNDPSDATKDFNGNGINNLLEYRLGLDPTDTNKPAIVSAVGDSVEQTVTVTFSKNLFRGPAFADDPRNPTLATNLANYSIRPPLAITGAAVQGNVVTLSTTNTIQPKTAYTLTVKNVRDVNNWPVAPDTHAAVTFLPDPIGPLAQRYRWITVAGAVGQSGTDDGTNSAARFNSPWGIALDSAGALFVADSYNHTIRKLNREGSNWVTTTIAGWGGRSGGDDGTNSAARFNCPNSITLDAAGYLYVADLTNNTIRKIIPLGTNWVTTTIAGVAGQTGSTDGTNSGARFNSPSDIAIDKAGNLFVTDSANNTIRKLTPVGTNWVTTTIAGKAGPPGTEDGTNGAARFNLGKNGNSCVVADNAGDLFVTDIANHRIRKLMAAGTDWVATTLTIKADRLGVSQGLNSDVWFFEPNGLALDAGGNLYVVQSGSSAVIRKLAPVGNDWVFTTIGGREGSPGAADGTNSAARFRAPGLLKVDSSGNVYLADGLNHTIRMGIPFMPVIE